jgi:hypothetical protein
LVADIYTLSFSVGTGNATEGETNFDVVQNVLSFEIDRINASENRYFAKWNSNWGNVFFNTLTEIL